MQLPLPADIAGAIVYIIGMGLLLGAFGIRKIKVPKVANPAWYQTAWARVSATALVALLGISFIAWQSGAIQEFQKQQQQVHQVHGGRQR